MKKTLTSIVSLILALVMIFPVGVFAAGEQFIADKAVAAPTKDDAIVIYDGGTAKNSVQLEVENLGDAQVQWITFDTDKITVDSTTGVVTAKANVAAAADVTVEVRAVISGVDAPLKKTITIKKYEITSIEVADTSVTDYVVGQTIRKSDIDVIATYSDGSHKAIENFTIVSPTGSLRSTDAQLVVCLTGKETIQATKPIKVANVDHGAFVDSISIVAPTTTTYQVGDTIKPEDIRVKIVVDGGTTYATPKENANIQVSASTGTWNAETGYTFGAAGSVTLAVTYGGKTTSKTFTVTNVPVMPTSFTVTVGGTLTKKEYYEEDKFDPAGLTFTVKDGNGNGLGNRVTDITVAEYEFTEASSDATKTYTFTLNFKVDGVAKSATFTVTGITVKELVLTIDEVPTAITYIQLKKEKYPVGYVFSLADIKTVKARFLIPGSSTATEIRTLTYEDLILYEAYLDGFMDLEVLDADGELKRTSLAHKLQETDLDKNGLATLLFTFGSRERELIIETGDADITFIYDGEIIAEYDDIEEALDATVMQDPNIDESIFDLDTVSSRKYITIKLGKDYSLTKYYKFNPEHNVMIDLNGHTLTMKSTQIEVTDDYQDFYAVIANNSSTKKGTLIYSDLELDLVLAEGERLFFEYDTDVPGLYIVTIDADVNATVTAKPAADRYSKIEVGQGSSVTFTITPDDGYELDYIKVGTKEVASADYTVASTGVVTYVLKDVSKSQTVYVVMKEKEPEIPFTDVSPLSQYYEAVGFVYQNKFFTGKTETRFAPNDHMTRAQFVAVIGRLAEKAGVKISDYKSSGFPDVPVNNDTAYYVKYLAWATQSGVIRGYEDGTFRPENLVTHQEMYVIMYRYSLFIAKKIPNLTYVTITAPDKDDVADWAEDAVKLATQKGYLVTTGSKILPDEYAKRYELAMVLQKFCTNLLLWK